MNDQELYEQMRREMDRAPIGDGDDLRRGRTRLRRRRVLVGSGGTGLAAVTLAVGSLAIPSTQSPEPQPSGSAVPVTTTDADGRIRVTFDRFADVEEVEPALEELGISAEVDFVPLDKECKQPRFKAAPNASGSVNFWFADPDAMQDVGHERPFTVVVDPDRLGPQQTVVLEAGYTRMERPDAPGRAPWVDTFVADGPVKPCEPVDNEDNRPSHM
jgi:hypothetical protein